MVIRQFFKKLNLPLLITFLLISGVCFGEVSEEELIKKIGELKETSTYYKGIYLAINGKLEEAKIEFEKILHEDSRCNDCLFIIKDVLDKRIKKETAIYMFRGMAVSLCGTDAEIIEFTQAINSEPDYALAYFRRGLVHSNAGHYEKAIYDFDVAILKGPQQFNFYLERGRAYDQIGQYDKAISDFNRSLEIDPEEPRTYQYKIETCKKIGYVKEMAETHNKFIQYASRKRPTYYFVESLLEQERDEIGLSEEELKMSEDEIKALQDLKEIDPDNKGMYLAMEGNFEEAKIVLEKDLNRDPLNIIKKNFLRVVKDVLDKRIKKETGIYIFMGISNAEIGGYDAIRAFTSAINNDLGYALAYVYRGLAYYSEKSHHEQEAISDFNAALLINPKEIDAYINRGMAYGQIGQYDKAISDFNQALEIDSGSLEAYYEKAKVYEEVGYKKEAVENYKKFIQLAPLNYPLYQDYVQQAKKRIQELEK